MPHPPAPRTPEGTELRDVAALMAADTDTRWHPVAAWLNAAADEADHAATDFLAPRPAQQFPTHAWEFTSHPAAVACAYRDARAEAPPPHTETELRAAARFTPDAQHLYPAQIAVRCDRCGVVVVHDYIVSDAMPPEQRLDVARAHLRAHGWDCQPGIDLCPTHAQKPANDATAEA